ncbi:hypothetical protein VTL71DRAFT_6793 [Oculimacula yallundae]|uniref:Uncharacterized protein n=1 Tax=Oculimacula yallundae TaxID=86028 RepID=A0ABR4BY34_9HELO
MGWSLHSAPDPVTPCSSSEVEVSRYTLSCLLAYTLPGFCSIFATFFNTIDQRNDFIGVHRRANWRGYQSNVQLGSGLRFLLNTQKCAVRCFLFSFDFGAFGVWSVEFGAWGLAGLSAYSAFMLLSVQESMGGLAHYYFAYFIFRFVACIIVRWFGEVVWNWKADGWLDRRYQIGNTAQKSTAKSGNIRNARAYSESEIGVKRSMERGRLCVRSAARDVIVRLKKAAIMWELR